MTLYRHFFPRKSRRRIFIVLCTWTLCLSACSKPKTEKPIRIISWNLQTFFDAHTDGTEYAEFRGAKSLWSREKYESRLDKLAAFIKEHPADIYVFQEAENAAVLQDIANRCTGAGFSPQVPIGACFTAAENGALGIGVLSHLPFERVRVHQTDIRAYINRNAPFIQRTRQPPLRPLLEIHVQSPHGVFALFACHWKSKVGDSEANGQWRRIQETVLAQCIAELTCEAGEKMPLIVCGDFNRDLSEFNLSSQPPYVCFEPPEKNIRLFSAWLSAPAEAENASSEKESAPVPALGSYYFRDSWEKIDHFFYNEFTQAVSFYPMQKGAHVQSDNTPFRYNIQNNTGFSDHLPLCFEFLIKKGG